MVSSQEGGVVQVRQGGIVSGHVLAVVPGCIGFVGTPADMVNVRSVRP